MERIIMTDFTGGIQESTAPDDFTNRQWAQLKGFVPRDADTFESQWAAQRIGDTSSSDNYNFRAVFPLQSQVGTFLVGIKLDGTVWWVKAPAEDATYTTANGLTWTQLTTAENYGWSLAGASVSKVPVVANEDNRFITGVPFEVYKYNLTPDNTGTNSKDLNRDSTPDTSDEDGTPITSAAPRSIVSGVLMHSRRYYNGGAISATSPDQTALVAFVNPNGNSGAGTVQVCTFPNIRRWPTKSNSTTAAPVDPFRPSTNAVVTFLNAYPFSSATGAPRASQVFHPYTYLDANSTLLPGRGLIPRGNVGTMWGNSLIIGDIEWRSDAPIAANDTSKITPIANSAPLGWDGNPFGLRDGNTEPHRGSFYYSEDDIDKFDPRSVLRASGTDTRIAGMHMLDNQLIIITTAGGENDGVIGFTGNLFELKSYDETVRANPFAIRKRIIRGGVGVADYLDGPDFDPVGEPLAGRGHVTQSCVWSEAGIVVFVDRLGGIYYTNGEACDRLDRYGPKQPPKSTFRDHPAAVGKHLVVWRNNRLLVFTILTSSTESVSGCWTEIIPPVAVPSSIGLRSMVGSGRSLYFVQDNPGAGRVGEVWRYALDGPATEQGCVNGTPITLTMSTRTVGDLDKDVKFNWHSAEVSFSTNATCTLTSVTAKAGPALQSVSPTPNPGTSQILSQTLFSGSRSFTNGYYTAEFPAKIGSQPQLSVTVTFTGPLRLEAVSFLHSGSTLKRGGTQ
jgi:hypothetical protein